MREVFLVADNIISPLGMNTEENFSLLKKGVSGVSQHPPSPMSDQLFYAALMANDVSLTIDESDEYTKFEQLLIASIKDALSQTSVDIADKSTILIISTTKGNISLLETANFDEKLEKRIALHTSAKMLETYFNCGNPPLVVSNACISGSLAMLIAKRLVQSGRYDHAVVAGADVISKFVLSGFQSFQAVSATNCKPFDSKRTGINLGEGAGTIILSSDKKLSTGIKFSAGATSNDANHISGPSRTGEELCLAIKKSMQEAELSPTDIGYISAHGTATVYNDEMEALAISLAGLQSVPVNSLKGYYGHTLGAAGLIESVIAVHSLQENLVLGSKGFEELGVSKPLNIQATLQQKPLRHCIKMASGFGGCNAAIIFSKQ